MSQDASGRRSELAYRYASGQVQLHLGDGQWIESALNKIATYDDAKFLEGEGHPAAAALLEKFAAKEAAQ